MNQLQKTGEHSSPLHFLRIVPTTHKNRAFRLGFCYYLNFLRNFFILTDTGGFSFFFRSTIFLASAAVSAI